MSAQLSAPGEREGRSLFVSGHFSDRVLRGEVPTYGYPKNHLPETTAGDMDVKTGFIEALKARRRAK